VTVENSCVQLVPGSHRHVVPHVAAAQGKAFGQEADPAYIDTSSAINMELEPGQFFLFNERLLHHSDANRSDRRRMGFTMRYTKPFVKLIDQDKPPLFPGHRCVLVRGQDLFGLNRMSPPPAEQS
jgi:ectoine hydroxylase-related dioxygenase (phytanoyl-CoA dioxygenase family)